MKYVLKIKQLNQKQMNNYGIDIIKLLYNFKFIILLYVYYLLFLLMFQFYFKFNINTKFIIFIDHMQNQLFFIIIIMTNIL